MFKENLQTLCNKVNDIGAELILLTPPPYDDSPRVVYIGGKIAENYLLYKGRRAELFEEIETFYEAFRF